MEFRFYERDGRWHWTLIFGDGIAVARSETSYPSEMAARASVMAWSREVQRAMRGLRA